MNISARGIIMASSGEILCVKLRNDSSFWCLPGGKLEINERFDYAINRELTEELGIQPVTGNLLYMQQLYDNNSCTLTEVGFNILNVSDFINIDLSKTSHGMDEIEEFGFKKIKDINFLPGDLKQLLPSKPDLLENFPMQYFVNNI